MMKRANRGTLRMHIFLSDKVPYIVGLLVAVIGWQISQLVTMITSTRAVAYELSIDRSSGEVTARIKNVSRTKSLENVTFAISCTEPCFAPRVAAQPNVAATYGNIRAVPPNLPVVTERRDSAMSILYTNTVAAGGEFNIIGRLVRPETRVNFYFIPARTRPLDIYIYDAASLTGFVVENYLGILILFLCLTVGLLAASVIIGPGTRVTETQEVPK